MPDKEWTEEEQKKEVERQMQPIIDAENKKLQEIVDDYIRRYGKDSKNAGIKSEGRLCTVILLKLIYDKL